MLTETNLRKRGSRMPKQITGDCLNCSTGQANTKLAIALEREHDRLNKVLKRVREFNQASISLSKISSTAVIFDCLSHSSMKSFSSFGFSVTFYHQCHQIVE